MLTSCASSVARARCSALLTDGTLVSSSSATSVAFQRSTSHRISTARWRGGRCWSAATKASRIVSRAAATSAGSPSPPIAVVGHRLDPGHLGQRVQVRDHPAPARGRDPSAAPAARGRSACPGRRWSRCGRATSAGPNGPRSGRGCARRAGACPAPRPRPRTASRACGSSTPVSSRRCCSSSPNAGESSRVDPSTRAILDVPDPDRDRHHPYDRGAAGNSSVVSTETGRAGRRRASRRTGRRRGA